MSLPSNQAVNRNRRPRCLIMILTRSICQWEGRSSTEPDLCMCECVLLNEWVCMSMCVCVTLALR